MATPSRFTHPMDESQFREAAHELIEQIVRYHKSSPKPVSPVGRKPGDVLRLVPSKPPVAPESFESIAKDIHDIIIPALTHWLSPSFFAYFPSNSSYPGILGELLSAALGQQGMMWLTSPASTELEIRTMDWLAQALSLPADFMHESGKGGGVIESAASESILVAIIAARYRALLKRNALEDPMLRARLVAYGSDQTHSSFQKACNIAGLCSSQIKILKSEQGRMQTQALAVAMKSDVDAGRIPFFVCATVGTTSGAANDPVKEIGEICQKYGAWMHIDAAYSGSACICPEFRPIIDGVELADSFNFNPHKWLLVTWDCSAFFVRDKVALTSSMSINPEYLRNVATESGAAVDFRDWQIPLGRRFRALKLWFVMRIYGISGLQDFIRHGVAMAESFENWIKTKEKRLQLVVPRSLGLVCFRAESDEQTKLILERVNQTGESFLTHTILMGHYTIRAHFSGQYTQPEHVDAMQKLLKHELNKL